MNPGFYRFWERINCPKDAESGPVGPVPIHISSILGTLATIPYIIFILFTMGSTTLLRPKNVFKSNFALSAIVNLIGIITDLNWHNAENAENNGSKQCPESKECLQMYLIWWSSTGLTASVMLIELDRFLAIRYPLKYPLWITAERSLGACAVAQLGSLLLTFGTKISSDENAFDCLPETPVWLTMQLYPIVGLWHDDKAGDEKKIGIYFFVIVVIPYFICFFLSLVCALYVVRAMLNQVRKESKINPSSMASSTTKISCIEDCDGQDNKDEKSGILSAVNLLSKVYMSPKSIEEEEITIHQQTNIEQEKQPQRSYRTMSCPARLSQDGRDHLDMINDCHQHHPRHPERFILRHGSNFGLPNFTDLKREIWPTMKTLSTLFIYFLITSPLYISTVVSVLCSICDQHYNSTAGANNNCDCGDFPENLQQEVIKSAADKHYEHRHHEYDRVIYCYNVFILGLVVYPYVWLSLDRHFARKMITIIKKSYDDFKYRMSRFSLFKK